MTSSWPTSKSSTETLEAFLVRQGWSMRWAGTGRNTTNTIKSPCGGHCTTHLNLRDAYESAREFAVPQLGRRFA